MSDKPTIDQLRKETGISRSYASMILSGARPSIPRPLAIRILRTTGWPHPTIADLTPEQIDVLEQVEPYCGAPNERAA